MYKLTELLVDAHFHGAKRQVGQTFTGNGE